MSESSDLLAERALIAAELGRLAIVDQPVVEAEVTAIDQETSTLDANERANWLAWSAALEGDVPVLRIADRRAHAQRRFEAEADLDAARVAAAAVAPRRVALSVEITRIGREIFRSMLAGCLEEAIQLNAEAHTIVEQIREPLFSRCGASLRVAYDRRPEG